jgi:hypothetical protein
VVLGARPVAYVASPAVDRWTDALMALLALLALLGVDRSPDRALVSADVPLPTNRST